MTIHPTPEIEKALAERAQSLGATPETVALDILRERLKPTSASEAAPTVQRGTDDSDDLDRWYEILDELCNSADPEEDDRLRIALEEAHQQAKALVYRKMGIE